MTFQFSPRSSPLLRAGPANSSSTLGRVALGVALASCLAFPLHLLLSYPNRISVYPSLQVDAQAYDDIATNIARGAGLGAIPPFQPPGFVSLLAVVYYVFGHSWIAAK